MGATPSVYRGPCSVAPEGIPKFTPEPYLYDKDRKTKRPNRGMNSRGSTRVKPDRRYKKRPR